MKQEILGTLESGNIKPIYKDGNLVQKQMTIKVIAQGTEDQTRMMLRMTGANVIIIPVQRAIEFGVKVNEAVEGEVDA